MPVETSDCSTGAGGRRCCTNRHGDAASRAGERNERHAREISNRRRSRDDGKPSTSLIKIRRNASSVSTRESFSPAGVFVHPEKAIISGGRPGVARAMVRPVREG